MLAFEEQIYYLRLRFGKESKKASMDHFQRWAGPEAKKLLRAGLACYGASETRTVARVENIINDNLPLALTSEIEYIRDYAVLVEQSRNKTWKQTLEEDRTIYGTNRSA